MRKFFRSILAVAALALGVGAAQAETLNYSQVPATAYNAVVNGGWDPTGGTDVTPIGPAFFQHGGDLFIPDGSYKETGTGGSDGIYATLTKDTRVWCAPNAKFVASQTNRDLVRLAVASNGSGLPAGGVSVEWHGCKFDQTLQKNSTSSSIPFSSFYTPANVGTNATADGLSIRGSYSLSATFTVDASTDVFTQTAHGYLYGQKLTFTTTTTLPAGLLANTVYFVVSVPTANTYTVSATPDGTAVDLTTTGTGTQSAVAEYAGIKNLVIEDVVTVAGSFWLTAGGDSGIFFNGATTAHVSNINCTANRDTCIYPSADSTGSLYNELKVTIENVTATNGVFGVTPKRSLSGYRVANVKCTNQVECIVEAHTARGPGAQGGFIATITCESVGVCVQLQYSRNDVVNDVTCTSMGAWQDAASTTIETHAGLNCVQLQGTRYAVVTNVHGVSQKAAAAAAYAASPGGYLIELESFTPSGLSAVASSENTIRGNRSAGFVGIGVDAGTSNHLDSNYESTGTADFVTSGATTPDVTKWNPTTGVRTQSTAMTFGAVTATSVAATNLDGILGANTPAAASATTLGTSGIATIGNANTRTPGTGTMLQVAQAAGTVARIQLDSYGAQSFFTSAAYGGTFASPTALAANAQIGGYNAYGYNGTALVGPVATYRSFASQLWSVGVQGSYGEIATTPNGGNTLTAVIRFENSGGVTIPSTVTGGDKGASTLNVGTLYEAGTSLAAKYSGITGNGANSFTVGDGTGTRSLTINGATSTARTLAWQTAGSARWTLNANSSAESGSNAGSALVLTASDDSAATIDFPLSITRASGGTIALGGTTNRPITSTGQFTAPRAALSSTTFGGSFATSVGQKFDVTAATTNNTGAGGTLAIGAGTFFGIPTWTADNATTYTAGATVVIAGVPVASTGVTCTTCDALRVMAGLGRFLGGITVSGGTNINASVNSSTNINTGSSNQNVTIGNASNLLLLPGIATDATHTDTAVCQDTTTHAIYSGSGTLGVCLGTSSARYKKDVVAVQDGLAQINALAPVNFRYIEGRGDNGAREQYGFLAEDVAHVLPKLVGLDADKAPNTVDLLGVVPVLVKAVQELQQEIDTLKPHDAAGVEVKL